MRMLHVSVDIAVVVATQVKAGKSLQQIARQMGISVEMATIALQKAFLIERKAQQAH